MKEYKFIVILIIDLYSYGENVLKNKLMIMYVQFVQFHLIKIIIMNSNILKVIVNYYIKKFIYKILNLIS